MSNRIKPPSMVLSPGLKPIIEDAQKLLEDPLSPVYRELGEWIVDIILDNTRYEVKVEDYGYDRSTRAQRSKEGFRLADYDTVRDFMENEYSGQTVATYCSGSGLAAQTLSDVAVEIAQQHLFRWAEKRVPVLFDWHPDSEKGGSTPASDFDENDFWDAMCEYASEHLFIERFGELKLQDVWNQYLSATLTQRAQWRIEKDAKDKERQRVDDLTERLGRELLTQLNNKWKGRRFEKTSSTELKNTLRGLSNSGAGQQVAAAMRLAPREFSLSNSLLTDMLNEFPLDTRQP